MTVRMANAPASFLLKDEYTSYQIERENLNQKGYFTLESSIPSDVTSVSFIPVQMDGTPEAELFRVEW